MSDNPLLHKKCVPCEGGAKPLISEEIKNHFSYLELPWEIDEDKKIKYEFQFKDFKGAIDFVNKVATLAEDEGHHPDIDIRYNKVKIKLTTHAIGGLSTNDFILAAKIEQINNRFMLAE